MSSPVPELVSGVAQAMSGYPARWALCGGWAVDAWLGRETREHGDIDVTVLTEDAPKLFAHLGDWQLVGHGATDEGETNEQWDGRQFVLPAHLHCRGPESGEEIPRTGALFKEDGFGLEIVFNELTGDGEWLLGFVPDEGLPQEPLLSIPLYECIRESRWGVPTMAPEVLLFYKATAYKGTRHYMRRRDHVDFDRLAPQLPAERRSWLSDAIRLADTEHPWLEVLAAM